MVIYMYGYKLNDFNLTSTESDFLQSPLDEVIEVAPPQGKLFFFINLN